VDKTIFFDDDGNALGKAEADRLVKVEKLTNLYHRPSMSTCE
jgi:hypothetical protein